MTVFSPTKIDIDWKKEQEKFFLWSRIVFL